MPLDLVPEIRILACNPAPVKTDGDFVLYWMIAHRRPQWNFSLQRSVEWAKILDKPLVVLEPLRCGYRWACDRHHRFVLDGMADNAGHFENTSVLYYPYVEPAVGAGKGLLPELASRACVVVTDDFPCFFLPRMVAAAARQCPVRLEKVDSNGLLPLRAADRVFATAYSFRRFLQKSLPFHLSSFPAANSLEGEKLPRLDTLSESTVRRWPKASAWLPGGDATALSSLPIDHSVRPLTIRGGTVAAQTRWRQFSRDHLTKYPEARQQPVQGTTSRLSPYLHFGHISVHQVFAELASRENWSPGHLSPKVSGSRTGWWGVSHEAESFLDEIITWRELGYNLCWQRDDYDQYRSLPEWALQTLDKHAADPRPFLYSVDEFENSRTHDPLWNAAQLQLVREGHIHGFLRMLWGKKILEWSATPSAALEIMIGLNNKYAIDGRNPNSYSGIFWCLGRYDRPWGPERPIFGTVRYMSSENTARKLNVWDYIRTYS